VSEYDAARNATFPINPDPDCPHCSGTGFSCQHRPGFDLLNLCECSAERLSGEQRQLYLRWRW
jgi:hypothetical protein